MNPKGTFFPALQQGGGDGSILRPSSFLPSDFYCCSYECLHQELQIRDGEEHEKRGKGGAAGLCSDLEPLFS